MKSKIFTGLAFCTILLISTVSYGSSKVKLRLSAGYYHEMGNDPLIKVKSRAKIDGKTVPIADLEIQVVRLIGDSALVLGSIKTDQEGLASYTIPDDQLKIQDTSGYYYFQLMVEGNEVYKDVVKSVQFKPALLNTEIKDIGGTPHIYAKLYNSISGDAVIGEGLVFSVDRLFKALIIGEEEIYFTDEDGLVLLPFEDSIPGIEGRLNFIVKLDDSEDYGTLLSRFETDLGTNVVLESTYDQRTMWSPPNKTPWILIIVPNIIIVAVWGTLLWLMLNLYKIYKN